MNYFSKKLRSLSLALLIACGSLQASETQTSSSSWFSNNKSYLISGLALAAATLSWFAYKCYNQSTLQKKNQALPNDAPSTTSQPNKIIQEKQLFILGLSASGTTNPNIIRFGRGRNVNHFICAFFTAKTEIQLTRSESKKLYDKLGEYLIDKLPLADEDAEKTAAIVKKASADIHKDNQQPYCIDSAIVRITDNKLHVCNSGRNAIYWAQGSNEPQRLSCSTLARFGHEEFQTRYQEIFHSSTFTLDPTQNHTILLTANDALAHQTEQAESVIAAYIKSLHKNRYNLFGKHPSPNITILELTPTR